MVTVQGNHHQLQSLRRLHRRQVKFALLRRAGHLFIINPAQPPLAVGQIIRCKALNPAHQIPCADVGEAVCGALCRLIGIQVGQAQNMSVFMGKQLAFPVVHIRAEGHHQSHLSGGAGDRLAFAHHSGRVGHRAVVDRYDVQNIVLGVVHHSAGNVHRVLNIRSMGFPGSAPLQVVILVILGHGEPLVKQLYLQIQLSIRYLAEYLQAVPGQQVVVEGRLWVLRVRPLPIGEVHADKGGLQFRAAVGGHLVVNGEAGIEVLQRRAQTHISVLLQETGKAVEIPLPFLRGQLQQGLEVFNADISSREQKLRVVPFGEAVLLLPAGQFFHSVVIAGKVAGHILVGLDLLAGGAVVKSQLLLIDFNDIFQGRPVVEHHQIHINAHRRMMAAVGHEQREKLILREQELKGPFRAQAGTLQHRNQLGAQLHGLRGLGHSGADILDVVAGIGLVEGVKLNPAVGNIHVVMLVKEHLPPVRLEAEIPALITAPGIGILIAVRQGDAFADLVVRQADVLMGNGPGAFEVFLRPVEHLLRAVAGSRVTEEDIVDLHHAFGVVLRDIQPPGDLEHLRPGLLNLLLVPGQKLVKGNTQLLL